MAQYLTGLGTIIGGYIWFLAKNREASYRAVLHETASRRQEKLYAERGFNPDRYAELIEDVKELRKIIKAVAEEYDLEWKQSETRAGKTTKHALKVIHKKEAAERRSRRAARRDDDDEDGDDEKHDAEAKEKEEESKAKNKS